MPICYFNANYKEYYRCQYEIKETGITVNVEYDIECELESINGIKSYGEKTKFNKRDILIVDHKGRTNYLLKNAKKTEKYQEIIGKIKKQTISNVTERIPMDILNRNRNY